MGKGTSSAVILSILIHAALFLIAGMLVVFTVVKKQEQRFEPPLAVERPKMKLKKPKVRPRKSARPKSTQRIVTRANRAVMPNIDLPKMSGMGDGLGDGFGDDAFGMMPRLEDISVFGSAQSIGNDFEGQFYSLIYNRRKERIPMGKEQFLETVRRFCMSGWNESMLSRFYRAPQKLYTTHFMVPELPSPMAPDVFSQPNLESYWFFVKYKGDLVYPEDIKFRFWGIGNAYMCVRVGGRHVLINALPARERQGINFWTSSSGKSDTYYLGKNMMKVGDWIELKAGEPVEMELLYGEYEGGVMGCMVLVEVEGVEYPRNQQGGPILPAFKTAEFSQDQLDEIMKFLAPYEANLTNGPVFRDYAMPAETVAAPGKTVEEQSAQESVPPEGVAVSKNREWTMKSGEKIEAELITQVGTRITLENLHGRQVTLAEDQFSEEDLKLIALLIPPTLEMEFSKKSTQRTFPETHSMQLPKASFYDFTARIKQTSRRPYPHPLTAEVFAIGEEVDGDNMILLDYKKESFHLPEGSQSVVEIAGSRTVQLMEYYLNDYLRGEKYGGYLIVITDARSEIIAHKGTSEKFFQNLDNLRRVPVGRYFDKDCNRCTPTRPKKWY